MISNSFSEDPILHLQTNSPEFEVGNGKNYRRPKKSSVFFSRSVTNLARMVSQTKIRLKNDFAWDGLSVPCMAARQEHTTLYDVQSIQIERSAIASLERSGPGKNQQTRKHINKIFTGLSQDYPGTVPGQSRPFPEISWEFCLCVSLFPQEKGNT